MRRALKIGFITDNYPVSGGAPPSIPGGIGSYAHILGEELAARGHDVHVFTMASVGRHRTFKHNDVTVWQCPPWSKRREMGLGAALEFTVRHRAEGIRLNAYAIAVGVRRAASRGRAFDVLEAPDVGLLGSLCRGRPWVKRYVVRLHASTAFSETPGARRVMAPMDVIQREDALAADVVTAPTAYSWHGAEEYWGVQMPHVKVVGNPVRPCRVNAQAYADPHVADRGLSALFYGRLIYQKGIDTLAAAIKTVRAVHPCFSVTFVGPNLRWPDGRTAADVISAEAGPGAAVEILPPQGHAQLRQTAQRHTIGVFPSREETFGMTFLEAMAWGLPSVASDIAPFRELARDERHCLFARPGDSNDFAAKISRLLSDTELRASVALSAQAHAVQWSVENVADQTLHAWGLDIGSGSGFLRKMAAG